jgi:hypothetical protein
VRIVRGNQVIYDNFRVGAVDHGDASVGLAMTEQDFENEELNVTHVWVLSAEQIPAIIELLQAKVGKKSVVMPDPTDINRLRTNGPAR